MDRDNYDQIRTRLASIARIDDSAPVEGPDEQQTWSDLWSGVATGLRRLLELRDWERFEAAFPVVAEALSVSGPEGRREAMPRLFGDFTRIAIAAGFERTRFSSWLGPSALLTAGPGRVRGRVLYWAKGRGRVLGADRTIYFLLFSNLKCGGQQVAGGQLVEFTPRPWMFNGIDRIGAFDTSCIDEG